MARPREPGHVDRADMPCPAHRNLRASWQAPTGTAGVEWTPNHETNLYIRYNRGYKSGGFNLGPLAAPGRFQVADISAVKPEYIDDFEGGWKQNFGRRFQFDIAAFYYMYHGLQALNATTQNSSPPIQINELVNIEKATAYGVELESRWTPIDNLNLALNYSYLQGPATSTPCTFAGTAEDGVRSRRRTRRRRTASSTPPTRAPSTIVNGVPRKRSASAGPAWSAEWRRHHAAGPEPRRATCCSPTRRSTRSRSTPRTPSCSSRAT